MRVPRVYLDVPLSPGAEISIEGQIHHYLVQVLRLKPGAALTIFNGRGGEFRAVLSHAGRREGKVRVENFMDANRESPLSIALWQGIAKGARMDYALQKAVELGVCAIQPLITRYTAAGAGERRNRMAHWRAVIISACEQSGRTRLPELSPPRSLTECLTSDEIALGLVLSPRAERSLYDAPRTLGRVTILIGPEGGLSSEELRQVRDAGFNEVHMGPRILRTETAAVAALIAVQLMWGDLRTACAK
jgi:16S rRNA (uracil1498-N3)-methyltransferase